MSLSIRLGDSVADELRLSQGDKVVPVWHPIGISKQLHKPWPGMLLPNGRICRIGEISNGDYEFLNERDAFQVGKTRTTINDGKQFTLTLTLEGNALEAQAVLLGQDLHEYAAIRQGQTIAGAGHLTLIKGDTNENAAFCIHIPNVEVKLTDIPGATDGTSTYSIELTTRSEVYWTGGQVVAAQESWFDGTSPKDGSTVVTNAAAPDGTITAFTLGTGNGAGVAAAPLAVPFNRDAGGTAAAYLVEVRINGSSTSGYTYDAATGVITFSTAPADGAHLSVVYFVRAGAKSWSSSRAYGIGEIVVYNDNYYITDAAATAGTIPDGTTPWIAYTGFGWDGSAGVGTPVVPYVSGETSMFESLNERQFI